MSLSNSSLERTHLYLLNALHISGDGYVLQTEPGTFYEYGDEVELSVSCFDKIEGIRVHGPSDNAWGGTFEYSLDGGTNWNEFACEDCKGSNGINMPIAVSGDSTGNGQETYCIDGDTCTLVVS